MNTESMPLLFYIISSPLMIMGLFMVIISVIAIVQTVANTALYLNHLLNTQIAERDLRADGIVTLLTIGATVFMTFRAIVGAGSVLSIAYPVAITVVTYSLYVFLESWGYIKSNTIVVNDEQYNHDLWNREWKTNPIRRLYDIDGTPEENVKYFLENKELLTSEFMPGCTEREIDEYLEKHADIVEKVKCG